MDPWHAPGQPCACLCSCDPHLYLPASVLLPCSYRLVSFEAVTRRTDGAAANGAAAFNGDVGPNSSPIIIGEPDVPAEVTFGNSATAGAADIVVHLAKPAIDVASGYYLTLKYWTKGSLDADTAWDVRSASTEPVQALTPTVLMVSRFSASLEGVGGTLEEAATTWKITLPKSALYCGRDGTTTACGDGKFTLEAFGAYSYFALADSTHIYQTTFYTGDQVPTNLGVPVPVAYYGELMAVAMLGGNQMAAVLIMIL